MEDFIKKVIYQIDEQNLMALVDKLDAIREARKSAGNEDADKLITKKDVLNILNTSYTTLWRWEQEGVLVPIHLGGGRSVRYKLSDILKFKSDGRN